MVLNPRQAQIQRPPVQPMLEAMWGKRKPYTMVLYKTHHILVIFFSLNLHHYSNIHSSIPWPSSIKLRHINNTSIFKYTITYILLAARLCITRKFKSTSPPTLLEVLELTQIHYKFKHIMAASMGKLTQIDEMWKPWCSWKTNNPYNPDQDNPNCSSFLLFNVYICLYQIHTL